jgi:hypothetical protein
MAPAAGSTAVWISQGAPAEHADPLPVGDAYRTAADAADAEKPTSNPIPTATVR